MLWPLWVSRGRLREGLGWFDAAFSDGPFESIQPATLARALADRAMLNAQLGTTNPLEDARRALEIARGIGDSALIARALTACAGSAAFNPDIARPYVEEAIELARATGDQLLLCQTLTWHGQIALLGGDPRAGRIAAEEGRAIADSIGHRYISRGCRWALAWASMVSGDLTSAVAQFREVASEAAPDGDATWAQTGLFNAAQALCHLRRHRRGARVRCQSPGSRRRPRQCL